MIHLKNKWKLDAVEAPVMVDKKMGVVELFLYGFPSVSIIQCVCCRCELCESGTIDMVEPSCVLFVSSVINCVHCITGL
jgi:hypothetical protein